MFKLIPALFALLLTLTQAQSISPSAAGLVILQSPHSAEATLARLEAALEENGLTVVAIIDHAENAAGAGLELRPTRLVIFGNPEVGTPLMQSSPTVAIDLPQKMLIWEDETGQVYIAYNNPQYLAERHDLSDMGEQLERIGNALANLADAATAP